MNLKAKAHPTVAFVQRTVPARANGIGKNEELGRDPAFFIQPLVQQAVLVIEHVLQPLARDVALARPINRVTHHHVVSGN